MAHDEPRLVDAHLHVGDAMAHRLQRGERAPELHALAHMLNREVDGRLRRARHRRGEARARIM